MTEWYRARFTDARGRHLLEAWLGTFLAGLWLLILVSEHSWWAAVALGLTAAAAAARWIAWFRYRRSIT